MTHLDWMAEVGAALLDLALPCRCAGCGRGIHPLCPVCATALRGPPWPVPVEALQAKVLSAAASPVAAWPVGTPAAQMAVWSLPDPDERVRAVLRAFKDRTLFAVRAPLAAALRRAVAGALRDAPIGTRVLPVPSRTSALARRGFDPLGELCRGMPLVSPGGVRWQRAVRDQRGLTAVARRENLRAAFAVDAAAVAGRTWVLCDDVTTTGATLAELWRAVVAAGGRVCGGAALVAVPRSERSERGAGNTGRSAKAPGER